MPLHTRRGVIEAVLNDVLGLHNKPKAAVRSVHKLMGSKKKKKKNCETYIAYHASCEYDSDKYNLNVSGIGNCLFFGLAKPSNGQKRRNMLDSVVCSGRKYSNGRRVSIIPPY